MTGTVKDELGARQGRVFMGTLDDSVSRYPWMGVGADLDTLNYTLLFHALLGPPLCCRIGNLLYTEAYSRALFHPERSLLLPLTQSGFFQIHMRCDSINATIQSRLEEKTNSTEDWVRRTNWEKNEDLRARLDKLDGELHAGVGKLQYSPSFREEFRSLMLQLENSQNREFDSVFTAWRERCDGALTRSNFEKLAIEIFGGDVASIRKAMSVANSANHHAYGLGMLSLVREPCIDTMEIPELSRHTSGMFGGNGKQTRPEVVEYLFTSGILKTVEENLTIPEALIASPDRWPAFGVLLGEGPRDGTESQFMLRKQIVHQTIADIINGNGKSDYENRKQLAEACRNFSSFISGTLKLKDDRQAHITFGLELLNVADVALSDTAKEGFKEAAKMGLTMAAFGAAAGAAGAGLAAFPLGIVASLMVEKLKPVVIRNFDRLFVSQMPKSLPSRDAFIQQRGPLINALSLRQVKRGA